VQARYDKGAAAGGMHPITMGEDLAMEQVAMIQAQSVIFPELNVDPVQRRNYPYGTMAAHTMGFIGEATEKDLATRKDLKLGDLIGKRGVELMYDNYLRGKDGAQYWEYDSKGRRLGEYRPSRKEPVAGDNIYLTVDFELQRRAEQYFVENEFVGAVIALDPRNGEVLALVSSPAFNPNVFSKRFTPDVYRTISSNPFKVELNRGVRERLRLGQHHPDRSRRRESGQRSVDGVGGEEAASQVVSVGNDLRRHRTRSASRDAAAGRGDDCRDRERRHRLPSARRPLD